MIYTITLNPAIDKIFYLESDLAPEKNNSSKGKQVDLGGKGNHVSAVLGQLHQPNIAVGLAGSLNKNELVEIFNRYNMEHHYVDIDNQRTRESVIIVNHSGGSYMITEKGLTISESHIEQLHDMIRKMIKPGDIVVVGGNPSPSFTAADLKMLIRILKELNVYIACDVSKENLKAVIEEEVDFVKPNEHEINDIFPGDLPIRDKFRYVYENVPDAVCSLGAEGALFKKVNKLCKVTPPEVIVKSDTGAGDAFVAGYIYALSNNAAMEERVKWGVICSASKVQHYSSCEINQEHFEFIENNLEVKEEPL